MTSILKSATERLKASVRDIPDFPQKGIVFKDITPILQNGQLFRLATTLFTERYQRRNIDVVVAIDARGFLFAATLAYCLGVGMALVRKKGKLPYETIEQAYSLEYGRNVLEMHKDSIEKGQRVVIIDDVLATGGTVGAAAKMVEELGGEIVEAGFLVELSFLEGRQKLGNIPVFFRHPILIGSAGRDFSCPCRGERLAFIKGKKFLLCQSRKSNIQFPRPLLNLTWLHRSR